jgi:hypothetical protein
VSFIVLMIPFISPWSVTISLYIWNTEAIEPGIQSDQNQEWELFYQDNLLLKSIHREKVYKSCTEKTYKSHTVYIYVRVHM